MVVVVDEMLAADLSARSATDDRSGSCGPAGTAAGVVCSEAGAAVADASAGGAAAIGSAAEVWVIDRRPEITRPLTKPSRSTIGITNESFVFTGSYSISMRRTAVGAIFGTTTVSTPSARSAVTACVETGSSNRNDRANWP